MKIKSNIARMVSLLLWLTVSSFLTSCKPRENSDLLIGKWLFVKFEWPNYVPPGDEIISRSDKMFKDVVYTFTKDKEFKMEKMNGSADFNKQTTYVLKDNKYINLAVGQVIRIDYLDEDTLKIFVEGLEPKGIFKRH